jgi:hypothetical protein
MLINVLAEKRKVQQASIGNKTKKDALSLGIITVKLPFLLLLPFV